MPAGSGVIRYAGKRGVVWRVKYRDASGAQRIDCGAVPEHTSAPGRRVRADAARRDPAAACRRVIADKSADLGASTVGRDLSVLQAISTTARREELVEANPAERAERPKLPPFRPQILEPAEVARAGVSTKSDPQEARFVCCMLVWI